MVQHFFLTLLLCFVAFCTAASAQDNPDSPMGPPPSGQAPMGPPPGGFRNHKTQGTASPNGLKITSSTLSMRDKTFASDSADENAVQALGGTLYLTDCTLLKRGGDSDDEDGSSFYGTNAALAAYDGSTVCLSGGRIETSAKGANAIVASGGTVNVEGTTMNCTGRLSRGIHATNGGTINARNLTIQTAGDNSSVIATDRGGGTVIVEGGNYNCSGKDCAVLYSTGDIRATRITGASAKGEVGVIEGDNSITIDDCDLTSGSQTRGFMILQSGSGDSEGYNGRIDVSNSRITLTGEQTPLVCIPTNITGTFTLDNVRLTLPSGILMDVSYNDRWTTSGSTGHLILKNGTYNGDVVADSEATATVKVESGATWQGALNTANSGAKTSVVVEGTWILTADSYVDSVELNGDGKIIENGFHLIEK